MYACNHDPPHTYAPQRSGYRIVEGSSVQFNTTAYLVHWEQAEQYAHAHYCVQYPSKVYLPLCIIIYFIILYFVHQK